MRKTTLAAVVLIFELCCFSQQVSTNTMRYPDNFRVVGNRVFNIDKDTNWFSVIGVCETILTNGIIIRTPPAPRINYDPMVRRGSVLGESMRAFAATQPYEYNSRIFIANYPSNQPAGISNWVSARVIKAGMIKTGEGEQLRVFDWGKPYVVRIIKTNATNPPPKTTTSQ